MSSYGFVVWGLILLAPVIGGFIYGAERVVKARMQNRQGPPLMQPFYDLYKLMDKRIMIIHSYHASLGVMHFLAVWFATAMLFAGADLIMVIFLHLLASALIIMGGFSVKSIYSHLGANRELIATLSEEPIFILAAIALFMITGSFEVSSIMAYDGVPLLQMPLIFLALIFAILVKLKKSPFDAAEAHQEVVGGAEIEYSGIIFEAVYTAKWIEYVFIYGFIFLLTGAYWMLGAALCVVTFFVINAIDNSTARVNYQDMTRLAYTYAIPAALLNIVFIAL